MSKYLYDSVTNSFYPFSMQEDYEAVGQWPEKGVEINETVFKEFLTPPDGKVRGADEEGNPVWLDKPVPSDEEVVRANSLARDSLLSDAKSKMFLPQTKLLLGKASASEKLLLTKWIEYTDALDTVDLSNPVWPEVPES